MVLLSQESCFWMEACAWQGISRGVDVCDQFLGGSDLRYWQPFCVCGGLAIPASAHKQGSGLIRYKICVGSG